MPGPIPDAWKADVVRILKTEDEKHIEWTPPAFQRWKSDTNGAWRYEAYSSILESLSNDDIEGNETTSMPGQSATYEFLFQHGRIKMYGKIALLNDKLRILILSAHRAQRDSLRQ